MLTIAGKRFAETEKELVDSLFQPDPTPVGKAKRFKWHIHLFRLNGDICGVVSRYGVIGTATKQDNGKIWYSYGDCPLLGEMSLTQMRDEVESLSVARTFDHGQGTSYQFKA